jgi:hypothetical protein
MSKKITLILTAFMLSLLSLPATAQDELPLCPDGTYDCYDTPYEEPPFEESGEELAPGCLDGTLDCSGPTLEEYNAMYDNGDIGFEEYGESYPPECYDGDVLICNWEGIGDYYYAQQAAEAAANNQTWEPDPSASAFSASGTDCLPQTDFSQSVEVVVIQMRAGFSYTATAIGINGFDPSLAVRDSYGNGLCVDDDQYAAGYSAYLPTTGAVEPSASSAQISFTHNGPDEFANISLFVANTNNQPGEFILLLEGMAVTDTDGIGDPLSLAITPGMVNSGIAPTAYMLSSDGSIDSFVGLIDNNYNWLVDNDNLYVTCDDAGSSCWGNSWAMNDAWVAMSSDYWVGGNPWDAMLSVPLAPGYEGSYYNFAMRTSGMTTFGDYVAAFHIGIG